MFKYLLPSVFWDMGCVNKECQYMWKVEEEDWQNKTQCCPRISLHNSAQLGCMNTDDKRQITALKIVQNTNSWTYKKYCHFIILSK